MVNFELNNNRSQFIKTKNNKIILDAYNANPTSVTLAIKNFSQIKEFKKYTDRLVVLGDMLELGKKSNTYHQNIILLLEASDFKNCVLVGKYFKKTKCLNNYIKLNSVSECKKLLAEKNIKKTLILIKGSRKIQLEKIVDVL